MPNITVQENGDGTTRTVVIPERSVQTVVSNYAKAVGTLTSTNTSHEIDWAASEGVFICSGSFTGANASGANIKLQQYIGTEWITFNNGQKGTAGGFQFVTCAPKIRVLLSNHTSSTSVYYHVETLPV
jgi:hypothetical protein